MLPRATDEAATMEVLDQLADDIARYAPLGAYHVSGNDGVYREAKASMGPLALAERFGIDVRQSGWMNKLFDSTPHVRLQCTLA